MIRIVKAQYWHALWIGVFMREDDRQELIALGHDPQQACELSFLVSRKAFTALDNAAPLLIFGVTHTPDRPRAGIPWLLAAPGVTEYSRRLARESKQWLAILSKGYDFLYQIKDARNMAQIRWLEWLGFQTTCCYPDLGPEHRRFLGMRKECHV